MKKKKKTGFQKKRGERGGHKVKEGKGEALIVKNDN